MGINEDKKVTAEPKPDVCNVEETPDAECLTPSMRPDKGAINLMLVWSCLAFGASSFLFGYDDRVISPVAATPAFVSAEPESYIFPQWNLKLQVVVSLLTNLLGADTSRACQFRQRRTFFDST